MSEWQKQVLSVLAPEDQDPKRIREYARANGHPVGTRGRFKRELISQYVNDMTERYAKQFDRIDSDAVPF